MPTWTWRTVTGTRREWEVPTAEPWGACLGDIRSAILAASMAYREQYGLEKDAPLSDDAMRFKVTDDAIVISFTTEAPAA